MIKIGEINYLNVYPIYYYLKKALKKDNNINFMNFSSGSPAFLNGELEARHIDISPSSAFYYILNYKRSYIFPNLSISSKKKVKSIYLFSPKPIENFNENETIYITPETFTSINLLKVILVEIYKMDLNKIKFSVLKSNDKLELELGSAAGEESIKQGIFLHIGNNALKLIKNVPSGHFAYDLADIWYRYTGYPFVFALFIINKESYDKNKNEFDILYKFLIESKKTAVSGFREAALSILASDEYKFISYEELMDYWTECLSFDFGEKEIKGFNIYSELLYKNQLISSLPELNFV